MSVWDQEELHDIAEEVIIALRYHYFEYDDGGNNLLNACESREERLAMLEETQKAQDERSLTDYLDFDENEHLHEISFSEALEMSLETIKDKYLKDVLPKARGILRKGSMPAIYPHVVSGEVPDSYLDDLFALRWRENLKLRAIQWEREKRRKKEV